MNKKYKNGFTSVTMPLILIVSIVMVFIIGIVILNAIFPFIWYEKLNQVALKYMFVIEKYGYLTSDENENLKNDLKTQGFDLQRIEINAPQTKREYGEIIEFEIKYQLKQILPQMRGMVFNSQSKDVTLVIYKTSYSKR